MRTFGKAFRSSCTPASVTLVLRRSSDCNSVSPARSFSPASVTDLRRLRPKGTSGGGSRLSFPLGNDVRKKFGTLPATGLSSVHPVPNRNRGCAPRIVRYSGLARNRGGAEFWNIPVEERWLSQIRVPCPYLGSRLRPPASPRPASGRPLRHPRSGVSRGSIGRTDWQSVLQANDPFQAGQHERSWGLSSRLKTRAGFRDALRLTSSDTLQWVAVPTSGAAFRLVHTLPTYVECTSSAGWLLMQRHVVDGNSVVIKVHNSWLFLVYL